MENGEYSPFRASDAVTGQDGVEGFGQRLVGLSEQVGEIAIEEARRHELRRIFHGASIGPCAGLGHVDIKHREQAVVAKQTHEGLDELEVVAHARQLLVCVFIQYVGACGCTRTHAGEG